eukprot:TRINITY_DN9014_c0_g1_i1.p1 TRINITY_DN9014_c0_g1~~TRINITY_DN9014_c0_g1_i1.p1  ORF type:complete len:154 (-),score=18.56 TRINITY_DN9014_c0_g1_i1:30-491(-)
MAGVLGIKVLLSTLFGLSFCLFIAALICAAISKAGVGWGGIDVQTESVHAAYSLVGTAMGILTCLFGILLVWLRKMMNLYTLMTELAMVFVTFFFVCGAIGVWAVIVNGRTWDAYPQIWSAELALDIAGIFFLMAAILALIPQMEVAVVEGKH